MLFKSALLEGIRDGHVTLAFRRWQTARVKAGSEMRTSVGVVAIVVVEAVALKAISEADASKAGYETLGSLLGDIKRFGTGNIYRIGLRFADSDPRVALRGKKPAATDVAEITRRLERLDKASKDGAWTRKVLALIARNPAIRAGDLAALLGCETRAFKIRVRKLKELGLTESLEVGYRLSPRGAAYLKTAPRGKK